MAEVFERMRSGFLRSSMLMRIIWVNIGVFVALRVMAIVCMFAGADWATQTALGFIELPSRPAMLLVRPWTIVTYMFAQFDLMHILFNMLWLYWFGTIFSMVATPRQLLGLYLLGGLGGALFFVLSYNLLPLFGGYSGTLIGASAAVIAIVTATAIVLPNFAVNLFIIGEVKLKWIAIVTIGLVLIGIGGSNAGGEMSHLGGVAAGALWAWNWRRGRDLTEKLNRGLDGVANTWSRIREMVSRPRAKKTPPAYTAPSQAGEGRSARPSMNDDDRRELDAILDKIKHSGYKALTPDERQRLFDVSRKIK